MLLGAYEPRLDDKRRLILPAKFRTQLAGGLVITKGHDRCLYIYSLADFEEFYHKLQKAPITVKEARNYSRMLMASASDQIPDKQGRITVPSDLCRYAGIDRDLVVAGVGNHVEVWDKQVWETLVAENEPGYSDREEELISGVL